MVRWLRQAGEQRADQARNVGRQRRGRRITIVRRPAPRLFERKLEIEGGTLRRELREENIELPACESPRRPPRALLHARVLEPGAKNLTPLVSAERRDSDQILLLDFGAQDGAAKVL